MNEFDNFVDDGQAKRPMTKEEEYKKALEKSHVHFADLRKMETIDFAFGGMLVDEDKKIVQVKPRMSEVDRKIQTQIFLANIGAIRTMDMDIEDKAKRICELSKAYEEVVK